MKMNKRNLVIASSVIVFLALAFVLTFYGNGITGFITNEDEKNGLIMRFNDNGVVSSVYKSNLGVDDIELPEGAKDVDAIMLLASLYMNNDGRKIINYGILDSIRPDGEGGRQRFKAFYSEEGEFWKVSYYSKNEFLKVTQCHLKIDYAGELISLDCS